MQKATLQGQADFLTAQSDGLNTTIKREVATTQSVLDAECARIATATTERAMFQSAARDVQTAVDAKNAPIVTASGHVIISDHATTGDGVLTGHR